MMKQFGLAVAVLAGGTMIGQGQTGPEAGEKGREGVLNYHEKPGVTRTYRYYPGVAQAGNGSGGRVQPGQVAQTNSGSYDPMQFYRQNPELMKRYFPHMAQGPGVGPGVPGTYPGQPEKPEEPRFDIEFPGGNSEELVVYLRDIFETKQMPAPNFLIAPEMRQVEVPPFELQNVTVADIFEALNNLGGQEQGHWELSGSASAIWMLNPSRAIDPLTGAPIRRNAYASGFGPGFPGQAIDPLTGALIPQEPRKITSIYPLGRYLDSYRVEDITTAIQTAWEMMPGGTPADLKYHQDTRLLIAVGTTEQLALIQQILSSLEGQPKASKMTEIPIPKKEEKARTPEKNE